MLIRMFVDNLILSVLLLAGVSLCTAEEDGYDYSKPLVGFSDGFNSPGSQTIYTKPKEYIVAATTPKPAAVYTVKPQTSISQGFGQYKAPIVTKPQTSFGGSSSFAQSSTSFSRPVSSLSQYGQGFGQSSVSSGSGQYVSGQYKTPVVSVVTSKPQTNFGAYQGFGQSVSTLGSGQYKVPVVSVTSKPQTNSGAYQGFGQTVSTLGSGLYKAPAVSVTSKPQTSFGSFQGVGQSNIDQGQYQSSIATKFKPSFGGFQSIKPQVSVVKPTSVQPITIQPISVKPVTVQPVSIQTVKPIIAKPFYAKPIIAKPVAVQPVVAQPIAVQPVQVSQAVLLKPQSVKPLSGIGAFQGLGFSKPFGGFGNKINQQPLKTVSVATSKIGKYQNAQYQAPSTGYTQTTSTFSQKPLTSFTNIGPSYLPPSKPLSAITIQPTLKPAVAQYTNNIQGSSSTVAPAVLTVTSTPRPAVITAKPQTSFNTFQGFGQTISKPAVVQYQKPIVVTTAKPVYKQPVVQYQKPLVSAPIKTQTFQSFGQTSYQKPVVSQTYFTQSSTAKPGLSYLPPKAEVSLLQPTSERYTSTPTTIKPIIVTSKPAVSTFNTYGQQSATQYSVKPLAITPKPQVSVSSFAQSVYQKPALSTLNTYGQQSAIKYTNTPTTVKPLTKPQSAFSGFGQSIYQKPAISTFNTYGQQSAIKYTNTPTTFKPITVTAKPQTAYNTFGQQTSIKYTNTPQTAFSGYGQSVYQKPAISTFNTYGQQSAIKYTNTPTTAKPFTVTAKPQTAFSGYGQTVYQKPAISTFNTYGQQSAIKYTNTPTTAKPFTVTTKPQTAFSGYGQTVYQKPAISTLNTYGQQSAIKYTSTPTTLKPIITVTAKPQTAYNTFGQQTAIKYTNTPQTAFSGYGQSVYQKPAISTFNTYGQQSAIKYTSTPTTLKPIISVTAKPQTAFSGYGQSVYQKPAVSTFNTYGQQSAIKYTSTPTTLKPIISVTAKPQTAFSGYGQSVYQKPAISTLNTYGQQSAIKYTSTPTTLKPIITVTAKPQTAYNTFGQQTPIKYTNTPQTVFSGYGQSVYQKPAISTFNTYGQQPAIKYTSTPTTLKPIITVTTKPQAAFSGFAQSVYQKPAISTLNTYGQQSAIKYTNTPTTVKPLTVYQAPIIVSTTAKPQEYIVSSTLAPSSITLSPESLTYLPPKGAELPLNAASASGAIKYTSTPTTLKPIITVTAKPQTAVSGFGQSVYQKPAISTLNTYGQQSAIKYTNAPTTVKPLTVYQAPIIVSTTAKPQEHIVSSTLTPSSITLSPESLTYLPPKGAELPLNAASASGAVSESFFEFPSATANQVVDVAQEQKVGGFGELLAIRNQRSSSEAQEQKVEGIDLRSNKLTETNNGQEEDEDEISSGNIDKVDTSSAPAHRRTTRDTYSNKGYQDEYTPPIGYLSYQGNPITSQQFGGVQPNSYQGIPYQQIVQAQTSLGIEGRQAFAPQQSFQNGQYHVSNNGYGIQNQDPYNFEGQYGYISSVEDQQQQIPQQNYEAAASYTDTVNTQIPDDSSVQDPKPLNREEQQARQVEEKPENNFQNLQPGSYIGPHVNKNSDQEYNVFDYDQFSTNPEDADTDADV